MTALLRFEARLAAAALRRVVMHPSRRMLWFVVSSLASAAIAVDIATSGRASRNLGPWSPSPLSFVLGAALILAIAALAGTRTPLTYGTRPADRVWWRYAGVGTTEGRRATTAILAVRATAYVAWGAVPLALLFALVAPDRAAAIVALAIAMLVLAPSSVAVAAWTARGLTARAESPAGEAPPVDARTSSVRASRVPRGLIAARWLAARRHRAPLTPYTGLVFGAIAGFVAPRFAAVAGGQLVSTVVVMGGLAMVIDGAVRGTTAPAELRSPWWRSALGTSAPALIAWAAAGTVPFAFAAGGAVLGFGAATQTFVLAAAALPAIALAPVALRLLVFGVDVVFATSADRRSVAALLRVAIVGTVTTACVGVALAAGARGGMLAGIATLTMALAAVVIASASWCARRLPEVAV